MTQVRNVTLLMLISALSADSVSEFRKVVVSISLLTASQSNASFLISKRKLRPDEPLAPSVMRLFFIRNGRL